MRALYPVLLQTGKQIVSKLNNTAAISTSYILVSLINSVKIERRVYVKYVSRINSYVGSGLERNFVFFDQFQLIASISVSFFFPLFSPSVLLLKPLINAK